MTTLSLSGGGFRAAAFHLGVIRYLRDIDCLRHVDLVCGVSGGAIVAAHLVHNWESYLGTDEQFNQVVTEVVRFAQRDVRGRITRRLPLLVLAEFYSRWDLSRTGLFRKELTEFFGDKAKYLFAAAPKGLTRPDLHILATNLNSGRSWDFHPEGVYTDGPRGAVSASTTLFTTAFAVSASACFPAFFPPCEVDGRDFSIEVFDTLQYLSDGGIFDNLGVRTLRRLLKERREISKEAGDFAIISDAGEAFEMTAAQRRAGLLRTAFRAADIMSERIETLEYEFLSADEGKLTWPIAGGGNVSYPLVIVRIRNRVPEDKFMGVPPGFVQTAIKNIRTDLDRFSDTEIKWLARLGYASTRQMMEDAVAIVPSSFKLSEGRGMPWDPITGTRQPRTPGGGAAVSDRNGPYRATTEPSDGQDPTELKRILDRGARRRFRLFAWDDRASWANVIVLGLLALGTLLYWHNVTTQAGFFSTAYPQSYTVTVKYSIDVADNWIVANVAGERKQAAVRAYLKAPGDSGGATITEDLIRFLKASFHSGNVTATHHRKYEQLKRFLKDAGITETLPSVAQPRLEELMAQTRLEGLWSTMQKDLEERPWRALELDDTLNDLYNNSLTDDEHEYLTALAQAWRTLWEAEKWKSVEGMEGVGQAFLQVIGTHSTEDNKLPEGAKNKWKGILYYKFPGGGYTWLNHFLKYIPINFLEVFSGRLAPTILDFDGVTIKSDSKNDRHYDLCLLFIQRPGIFERKDIGMVFKNENGTAYKTGTLGGYMKATLTHLEWLGEKKDVELLCSCFRESGKVKHSSVNATRDPRCDLVAAFPMGDMTMTQNR